MQFSANFSSLWQTAESFIMNKHQHYRYQSIIAVLRKTNRTFHFQWHIWPTFGKKSPNSSTNTINLAICTTIDRAPSIVIVSLGSLVMFLYEFYLYLKSICVRDGRRYSRLRIRHRFIIGNHEEWKWIGCLATSRWR